MVKENSSWLIGNGQSVNFWTDKWLHESLANLMSIPEAWQQDLTALAKDFIVNNCWNIHECLQQHFPNIVDQIIQIHILVEPCDDRIVWDVSVNGVLFFKEAFMFLNLVRSLAPRFNQIWS